MPLARNFMLLFALLPMLLLAAAPLFPRGSDPRGFGPEFLVGVYAASPALSLALPALSCCHSRSGSDSLPRLWLLRLALRRHHSFTC